MYQLKKLSHVNDATRVTNSQFTPYTLSGKQLANKSDNSFIYNQIPIENQESLGDCTIFALFNWDYWMRVQQNLPFERFSECAEYYEELALLGHPGVDWGGYTWSAVDILETYGAMLENVDPYDPNYITNFKTQPPNDWLSSLKITAKQAQQITWTAGNYNEIVNGARDALFNHYSVLFGVQVSNQIYSTVNGVLTEISNSNPVIGGHEVILIDYDDTLTFPQNPGHTGYFKFRNEWGTSWGDQGDGYLSYDYLVANIIDGLVVGVPVSSTPQPYALTASFASSSTTVNVSNPLIIKTTLSGNPVPNQQVAWTQLRTGATTATGTWTTNSSGEYDATIYMAYPGTDMVSLSWTSADGVNHTVTTSAQWTAAPAPSDQNYKLSIKFATESPALNADDTLVVTTMNGTTPVANQDVHVTIIRHEGTFTPTYATDSNGQYVDTNFRSVSNGKIAVSGSWTAPNGKVYTASDFADWGNNPTPATHDYNVTANFTDSSVNTNGSDILTVSTLDGVTPVPNQPVVLSITNSVGIFSISITTDGSGAYIVPMTLGAGTTSVVATWKSSDGVSHTATANVTFTEYEVIVAPYGTQADAQAAATTIINTLKLSPNNVIVQQLS